jgi:mono/diheme cytochrome c family protein
VEDSLADQVEAALQETGAVHLKNEEAAQPARRRPLARLALVGAFVTVPTIIGLLFAYAVLVLPLPNQMVDQLSTGHQQGPRLAAPAEAVPVQGPALIGGKPASEPVPVTANSLQRGGILFDINCVMCHGQTGAGDGPLSQFYNPPPADLTSERVQALSDQQLFLVLTQGWGRMPSIGENLTPVERWDVVNHVHTLR